MALDNAHDIIKRVMINLFSAEERRLEAGVQTLIAANAEFFPQKPHDGFTYNGKPYDLAGLPKGGKRTRVSLHQNMVEQMEAHLQDHEKVWTERYFISQMLFQLLKGCNDLQDIRDALPNCITDTLEELKGLTRRKIPAYTLKPDPRLYRQYEKLLPRIEFYATMKMFY